MTLHQLWFAPTLLLLLCLLSACASPIRVNVDYQTEWDFGRLQTYAWLEREKPPSDDIRIDNDLYKTRVVSAVDNALRSKGLKKLEGDRPDFLVTWFGAIEKKMRADTINQFYPPYWSNGFYGRYGTWGGGFSTTQIYEFEVNILIIDLLAPQDKQLIWRGTARSIMQQALSLQEKTDSIKNKVAAILQQFPPP